MSYERFMGWLLGLVILLAAVIFVPDAYPAVRFVTHAETPQNETLVVENNTPANNPCNVNTLTDARYAKAKGYFKDVMGAQGGVISDINKQINEKLKAKGLALTQVDVSVSVVTEASYKAGYPGDVDEFSDNAGKSVQDLEKEASDIFKRHSGYTLTTDQFNGVGNQKIKIGIFCKRDLQTRILEQNVGEDSVYEILIHELVHAKVYAMRVRGVQFSNEPFRDHDKPFKAEIERLVKLLRANLSLPALPDGDADDTPDGRDKCPNTPEGQGTDRDGCSQSQVDKDADGVCDNHVASDLCTGSICDFVSSSCVGSVEAGDTYIECDPGLTFPCSGTVDYPRSGLADPITCSAIEAECSFSAGVFSCRPATLGCPSSKVAVGGVVELPEVAGSAFETDDDSVSYAVVVAGASVGLVFVLLGLVGAAWRARRRGRP